MKRRATLAARAALVVLMFALPVAASADVGQYEPFTAADRRITDHFTKLEWERSVSPPIPFQSGLTPATTYCVLPTRLPTMKELLTLVDEEPHLEYDGTKNVTKMIDQQAFPVTPVDVPYWTSSMDDGSNAFTVDFATGSTATALATPGATDGRRVRCVQIVP